MAGPPAGAELRPGQAEPAGGAVTGRRTGEHGWAGPQGGERRRTSAHGAEQPELAQRPSDGGGAREEVAAGEEDVAGSN